MKKIVINVFPYGILSRQTKKTSLYNTHLFKMNKGLILVPTIEQIRAARALIGWSQSDLADQASLSQTGIARIENGTNQPNSSTLAKIKAAFDRGNIEFIGNSGVNKRVSEVRTLKGQSGFWTFYDDVYNTVHEVGGDICISNNDERLCDTWFGHSKWHEHKNRMFELSKIKDFNFRILTKEGDDYFVVSEFAEYRWSPKERFSDIPFYVYGKKLGIFLYEPDNVTIFVIDNEKISEAYKQQFNVMWDQAIKIPKESIIAAQNPIDK